MGIKYQNPQFNPDKLSKHNIDRMAVEEVPPESFVLDVGCATGFMGKYLQNDKQCRVVGLDLRSAELAIAKKDLFKVVNGDIQDDATVSKVLKTTKNQKFDVVIATSLIEHTAEPQLVLQQMKKLLKPKGRIIMSTPNVAHWTMRLSLLMGNFEYTEYGILDRTHLQLFTYHTFQQLFKKSKLKIVKVKIDAEGGGYPRISLALAPFFKNVFAYQTLVVATL